MLRCRCRRVLALILLASLTAFGLPDAAGAATRVFGRTDLTVQGKAMRTRGYLNDDCIGDIVFGGEKPCMDLGSGTMFRPEASAQAKAIQELSARESLSRAPLPSSLAQSDPIQWEVAPPPDSTYAADADNPGDPPDPAPDPACVNVGWRVDILVNKGQDVTILEVKNYGGGAAVTEVTQQLDCYIRVKAPSLGITIRANNTLNLSEWSTAYTDNLGNVWCTWAPIDAGHVYFAPWQATPVGVQQRTPGCDKDTEEDAKQKRDAAYQAGVVAALVILVPVIAVYISKKRKSPPPPPPSVPPTPVHRRPESVPAYQDANYWTCEGTYSVVVQKAPASALTLSQPETLRIEWGDGTQSDYPVPPSSGPLDQFYTLNTTHVFPSGVGRVYYQRLYVIDSSGAPTSDVGMSVTTHNVSQYDSGFSGSYPVIYPSVQFANANSPTSWLVVAERNPDRSRLLAFEPSGAGNPAGRQVVIVPQGYGPVTFSFGYTFTSAGCPPECYSGKIQNAYYDDPYLDNIPYTSPPKPISSFSVTWCSGCGYG